MLGRDEIVRSLTAAWRLFLNRPDAMRGFDIGMEGFWRSFGAILLVAPSYALGAMAERQIMLTDPGYQGISGSAFALDRTIALGLDWVALPIVVALLARPLRLTRQYSGFVVAQNWGTVLAVLPFGVIALVELFGFVDADTASFLSLAALIVALRYSYIITRRSLGVGISLAVGLVALDVLLNVVIAHGIDALFGAWSG